MLCVLILSCIMLSGIMQSLFFAKISVIILSNMQIVA
jgi:hypothetical protein